MWLLLQLLLLLLAALAASGRAEPCPPEDDVYPCYCHSGDDYLTSVNCERLSDLAKLEAILHNTKGKNISFGFWNSRLGDVRSDLFAGQRSTSLHFEQCQIGSFGDRPFSGLEGTLRRLFVYGSVDKRRQDLRTFPLGHLAQLHELIFQANDIKRLGNEWFADGPATLRDLYLDANDIEELGDRAFEKLVNLEHLRLGDNRFGRLARSMLPNPAGKLQLLEISFNGIEKVPDDFFEGMPVLTSVNLSGNKLQTIPEAIWGKVWDQLEEVYLERNSGFACDQDLEWIYRRSQLPEIFTGACRGGKLNGRDLKDLTLQDFQ